MIAVEARRVQDEARVRGEWLVWFLSVSGGKARAWAVVADRHGGKRQPGEIPLDHEHHADGGNLDGLVAAEDQPELSESA